MTSLFSLPLIILLFIFAVFSFFFALAETSIIGLSKIRLRHMLARAVNRSASIQRLVTQSDKFIVSILVGNNFVNIAFSVLVSAIFVNIIGGRWGIIWATLFSAFFILIFCEIIPKILALKNTEKMALFVSPIMEVFIKLINPLTRIFIKISDIMLKVLRIEHPKRSPLITEEELRLMIEVGREEGVLTDEERKMLHRIFEFGDIKLKDVMIPKEKIVALNLNSNSEEMLDIFVEEGHARLPVYRDSIDDIVGIIYARDLLYILRDKSLFILQDLIHKPYFVSPTLKVNELLRKFQIEKIQIAIVIDEKQKTLGMVTLEDLIEEIVGEIEEEYSLENHKN
jgi:putative hemolysin